MRVGFGDLDLSFSLGGAVFQVLNLVYEQLRRTIPSHSHGGGALKFIILPPDTGQRRSAAGGMKFLPARSM